MLIFTPTHAPLLSGRRCRGLRTRRFGGGRWRRRCFSRRLSRKQEDNCKDDDDDPCFDLPSLVA